MTRRCAPGLVAALNNNGLALASLGELQAMQAQYPAAEQCYAQAVASFDEALSRAPDHIAAHINMGNALCGLGVLQDVLGRHEQSCATLHRCLANLNHTGRLAPDFLVNGYAGRF